MVEAIDKNYIPHEVQNKLIFAENLDIFDPEVIEDIHNIKNGGYCSVKDILLYIVPVHILNTGQN
ncbi:hypothetical protein C1646_769605 [Rhizophagus diaphanus]|nr:hypothetical protein C1646_769605 [Rhizophagus diaphanus] [Rhizophagus sp. MUCL 43196]